MRPSRNDSSMQAKLMKMAKKGSASGSQQARGLPYMSPSPTCLYLSSFYQFFLEISTSKSYNPKTPTFYPPSSSSLSSPSSRQFFFQARLALHLLTPFLTSRQLNQLQVPLLQPNLDIWVLNINWFQKQPNGNDGYFKMDPENYDSYGGVVHAEYCFQAHVTCLSAFQAPLDPSTALGGFSGNNYTEASAFIVTYPVNNAVDDVGNENAKALAWEKAFIQLAKV
ncbi:unnamed protein product [Prunus armeniaca]|uniref:NPC1 middle luminal domain-containing protein n=1 Tax=Prunus armeniaca TaxID=36596 RepID=A0A6J5WRK8_PRUAR|nr:unnamed protein product [Prunus armeniaca]